jgi:hypothetical protein
MSLPSLLHNMEVQIQNIMGGISHMVTTCRNNRMDRHLQSEMEISFCKIRTRFRDLVRDNNLPNLIDFLCDPLVSHPLTQNTATNVNFDMIRATIRSIAAYSDALNTAQEVENQQFPSDISGKVSEDLTLREMFSY